MIGKLDDIAARVAASVETFDRDSGSFLERLIFKNRQIIVLLCALVTVFAGFEIRNLELNASFEKTIPYDSPYIQNYMQHKDDFESAANALQVVVQTDGPTVLDAKYLATLEKISDELYLMPGVNRPWLKSLWSTQTRWQAVTTDGFVGGSVMFDHYRGTPADLKQVGVNIANAGLMGNLVGSDMRSTLIVVPLLDTDPTTGKALDYGLLSKRLEALRTKYDHDGIHIRITGFGKVVGTLIQALGQMSVFFVLAVIIGMISVYWFTRCVRSTALVVACSLTAVFWQLGLLPFFGLTLDPYSILVPFLIFAIAMSHGAQKMNGVMQDIGRGAPKLIAARLTFRRLFLAGFTALMCDAIGFAVLIVIKIPVIQEMALVASLGVAIIIFTNLILLPILLSFTGVNEKAAVRSLAAESGAGSAANEAAMWRSLARATEPKVAATVIVVAALLALGGWTVSRQLQVGDLDRGAPELRPHSVYNQDNAYLTANYARSSDTLIVMVTTPPQHCVDYDVLSRVDRLEWQLDQLPGVAATDSLASETRNMTSGVMESNYKWYDILNDHWTNGDIANDLTSQDLFNQDCSLIKLFVSLKDHKAGTLTSVVNLVNDFAAKNDTADYKFLLAAGNAGIDAATNIVVERSNFEMLLLVYSAVLVLCFVTFRSWQAVLCAVLPLMLTSVLSQALMVWCNIGVKVAILPVIALGVGIGVDYALYVMSIVLLGMRQGRTLAAAFEQAFMFTGRVVLLTGFTLSVAVATWVLSPIKFQADMGLLLAFMFMCNMIGALVLAPALARFLIRVPRAKSS